MFAPDMLGQLEKQMEQFFGRPNQYMKNHPQIMGALVMKITELEEYTITSSCISKLLRAKDKNAQLDVLFEELCVNYSTAHNILRILYDA